MKAFLVCRDGTSIHQYAHTDTVVFRKGSSTGWEMMPQTFSIRVRGINLCLGKNSSDGKVKVVGVWVGFFFAAAAVCFKDEFQSTSVM